MARPTVPIRKVESFTTDKATKVKGNLRNRVDEALFLLLLELAVIPGIHVVAGMIGLHLH